MYNEVLRQLHSDNYQTNAQFNMFVGAMMNLTGNT